jgi:hypothetical protein
MIQRKFFSISETDVKRRISLFVKITATRFGTIEINIHLKGNLTINIFKL